MDYQLFEQDWNASPLGHPSDWSESLRGLVRLVRASRFPSLLVWGPEFACIYNDAYVSFLGEKHPAALGKPFPQVWPEIWPQLSPLMEKALQGESSYFEDVPFLIHRNGRMDPVWVTFSYSPAYDVAGEVAGVYAVLTDTTARVRADAQQHFYLTLADKLRELADPVEIMAAASELTGEFLGAGRVGYGEIDEDKKRVSVDRDWTNGSIDSLAGEWRPLDSFGPRIIDELRAGHSLKIDDMASDERSVAYAAGYASIGVRSLLVVPLLEAQRLTAIFYVHESAPRGWTAEEVTLVEDVARRTWDAVRRARVEEALRDETRVLNLLNKTGQTLASTLDLEKLLQAVTDAGTELVGARFGSFFYNGKDANGDALVLFTLSGAPREAFAKLGHPRPTAVFGPTFHGGPVIRSDDITQDPRYGQSGPHFGMPKGHLPVKSYLAASVISRSGDVMGGLFFGHPDAGVFSERSERIISGIAAQAAIAIDNARLYRMAQVAAAERQALLQSERSARGEAERLNRLKDEFLAMLAHELRNPLAPVSAAAQILKLTHSSDTKVRTASDIISRQVGHLTDLIDDLMDVSRVTRGLIELDATRVDIKAVIANAVEQVRPLIELRHHRLNTHLTAEHAWVRGDATRLVQIVSNLLNNAAKYTSPGGDITLDVSVQNEQVVIKVIDNGCGMDADLLPHVFDLFTQGTRALDRAQGGLGIGLALVKSLVQLHGGTVTALSEGAGTGSVFTLVLPQLIETVEMPVYESPSSDTSQLRILLVDDNLDAAQSLAILLEFQGHQVAVVGDAASALQEVAKQTPDVFILDIGLPDMNGYQLVRKLAALDSLAGATCIALTGYGQPQDREQAKAAGFHHHFVKPVNVQALTNLLKSLAPQAIPALS